MAKVRFLVIGAGRVGAGFDMPLDRAFPKTHCGAVSLHKNAELSGVVDPDKGRLKRVSRYFDADGFCSIDDALRKGDYDVAVISTAPHLRLELIEKLAGRVRGIICEKPMAETLSEAEKICGIVKKRGILFTVNFTRRWQGSFRRLKDLLNKKDIGDVQNVIEMYLYDSSGAGSHQADMNRFLFGEAEWAAGAVRQSRSFDCLVKHEKAVVSYVGCSQKFYTMGETIIWGTRGRIDVIGGGTDFKIFYEKSDRYYKKYRTLRPGPENVIRADYRRSMLNLVDNMIRALKKKDTLSATEIDGYRSMQLLETMKAAAISGEKVFLKKR